MTALWVAGAAVATTVVVVWAVLGPLTRHGVVDVPAGRSLHVVPTPRGGGLGVLAAVLVVVPVAGLAADLRQGWLFVALVAVAGLGTLGLLDDLRTLTVGSRLVAQLGLGLLWAVGAVAASGVAWVWVPVVVLAVVGLVNITNFMDGANGLISMHAVVASTWYLLVGLHDMQPGVVLLAAAALGGAVGFLPFNTPVARIFLGDVGSYTFGAVWAVLSTWLLLTGTSVVVVLAPLLVLVTDTMVTLVGRVLRGERPTQAHRGHVYQRLVTAGWSHTRVAVVVSAAASVSCLLGTPALLGRSRAVAAVCLAAMLLVSAAYLSLPSFRGGEGLRLSAHRKPARR